jgi:cell division protein ZapA (FtsZ GTPase activity inhibitor)
MKVNLKVKIRNVDFTIACEAGEEEKIKKLATYVDRRLNFLSQSFPGTNLMTLFFINSIMTEDENNDLKKHNQELNITFESLKQRKELDINYGEITDYIEKLIENIES